MNAQRELLDVGATSAGLELCEPGQNGNVMFLTYARLCAPGWLHTVVSWLGGRDADGLIVFDEDHHAKNLAFGKGTLYAKTVRELQDACPNSPVLYYSATACTDVSQMAYMP